MCKRTRGRTENKSLWSRSSLALSTSDSDTRDTIDRDGSIDDHRPVAVDCGGGGGGGAATMAGLYDARRHVLSALKEHTSANGLHSDTRGECDALRRFIVYYL